MATDPVPCCSERLGAQQEMLSLPYLKKQPTPKEEMYAEMNAAGKFFEGPLPPQPAQTPMPGLLKAF